MFKTIILNPSQTEQIAEFDGNTKGEAKGLAIDFTKNTLVRGLPYILITLDRYGRQVGRNKIHGGRFSRDLPESTEQLFFQSSNHPLRQFTPGVETEDPRIAPSFMRGIVRDDNKKELESEEDD